MKSHIDATSDFLKHGYVSHIDSGNHGAHDSMRALVTHNETCNIDESNVIEKEKITRESSEVSLPLQDINGLEVGSSYRDVIMFTKSRTCAAGRITKMEKLRELESISMCNMSHVV